MVKENKNKFSDMIDDYIHDKIKEQLDASQLCLSDEELREVNLSCYRVLHKDLVELFNGTDFNKRFKKLSDMDDTLLAEINVLKKELSKIKQSI